MKRVLLSSYIIASVHFLHSLNICDYLVGFLDSPSWRKGTNAVTIKSRTVLCVRKAKAHFMFLGKQIPFLLIMRTLEF